MQKAGNLFVCQQGHDNYIDASPAAVVYILKDDQVLFGVRSIEPQRGRLNTAGGFLNLYESAKQAAIREAKEELGVDIKLLGFLGTYPSDYSGRAVINITYIGEYVGGAIIPDDGMSVGEPQWRSIYDLPTVDELSWGWQAVAQQDLLRWWQDRVHERELMTIGL